MNSVCVVCREEKPAGEFYASELTKSGLSHECSSCADGMALLKKRHAADVRRGINNRYLAKKRIEEMLK